jgi:hypothetical protein
MPTVLAHLAGTGPDDWALALGPVAAFLAAAALLARPGREASPLAALAARIERATGLPAWAVGAVATGWGGLALAMVGFYWDVAWHIDLGRDTRLFTPPHTMILLGLVSISLAGAVAAVLATATAAPVGLRVGRVRVPWTAGALAVIGGGALVGFPLDDLWHRAYGVDVTMWSPTHLIMIGGASVATVALWLVLGEAGVRPEPGTLGRRLHAASAAGALAGLSALQGEFDFGVPQFQMLFHPVLVLGAAGVVLVAARLILGRGGALRATAGFLALRGGVALVVGGLGHTVPRFPLYLAPALAVEAAAWFAGRRPVGRFAVPGALVGSAGLAGEWAWAQAVARHPWTASLLPEALWVGALAALGGALAGAALGLAAAGGRLPAGGPGAPRRLGALALAGLAALAVALALPVRRTSGEAAAGLTLARVGDAVLVDVALSPPDAARGAHLLEAMAWQGGGLVIAPLEETGPGRYRAARPLPVGGRWKALVRLVRGAEMMAVPISFPADEATGAPAIPAEDRVAPFRRDALLLMREARRGSPGTARVVLALLAAVVCAWGAAVGVAGARAARGGPRAALGASRRVATSSLEAEVA